MRTTTFNFVLRPGARIVHPELRTHDSDRDTVLSLAQTDHEREATLHALVCLQTLILTPDRDPHLELGRQKTCTLHRRRARLRLPSRARAGVHDHVRAARGHRRARHGPLGAARGERGVQRGAGAVDWEEGGARCPAVVCSLL